jgi:curli biogenesis system outer membrane secretion channel CsgG
MVKKDNSILLVASFLIMAILSFLSCSTTRVEQNAGAFSVQSRPLPKCTNVLKKRLAIASFKNNTPYAARRIGESVSDMLATELAQTDCFLLLERSELNKVATEQALSQSGMVDEKFTIEAGKLLGANYLLIGNITQFGVRTQTSDKIFASSKTQTANAAIDLRMINTRTGVIKLSLKGAGTAERKYTSVMGAGSSGGYDESLESQAIREAIKGFSAKIVAALDKEPWSCSVAMVKDDKIYIDAGSGVGMAAGRVLTVYSKGVPITSPATGEVIGYDRQKLGEIQVIELLGEKGAVARLITGSMPSEKDICKLE